MSIPPTKKLTKEQVLEIYKEIGNFLESNGELFQEIIDFLVRH